MLFNWKRSYLMPAGAAESWTGAHSKLPLAEGSSTPARNHITLSENSTPYTQLMAAELMKKLVLEGYYQSKRRGTLALTYAKVSASENMGTASSVCV
jgi:hypothetical protein